MEISFYQKFQDAFLLGILGIHRLVHERDIRKDNHIPALNKATALFAELNQDYNLHSKDGLHLLPQTPYELLEFYSKKIVEFTDQLPENLVNSFTSHIFFHDIGPLFVFLKDNAGDFTDEGWDFFADYIDYDPDSDKSQISEYVGNTIYSFLKDGTQEDYIFRRIFLETREHVIISCTDPMLSDDVKRFISNRELFHRCYKKAPPSPLFICKKCGMFLREQAQGVFTCAYASCKFMKDNCPSKEEFYRRSDETYVMNEIVAHNIFCPGILEQDIKKLLQKNSGIVSEYELYPRMDTWDFSVTLSNGKKFLIDAKDIEDSEYIIREIAKKNDNAAVSDKTIPWLYVVPNSRSKVYISTVNTNIPRNNMITCLKFSDLQALLEREENNRYGTT